MPDRFYFTQSSHCKPSRDNRHTFKEFDATELYCPKCGRSMPVRKRLLLVLPEGDKYEYLCSYCATSVGSKVVRGPEQIRVIV